MTLTPPVSRYIEDVDFSAPARKERAYSAEEVDTFVGKVSAGVQDLERQTERLRTHLTETTAKLDNMRNAPAPVSEEVNSSVAILRRAEEIAQEHEAAAQERAAALIAAAEETAAQIVSDRQEEKDNIEHEIERLHGVEKNVRQDLYSMLREAQRVLQTPSAAEKNAPSAPDADEPQAGDSEE